MHSHAALIGAGWLETESATERFGRQLANFLEPGDVVFLEGELGAGKSTLARSILGAMGYGGLVRSPSYSLIHGYSTCRGPLHHLDLYRIRSLDEAIGLDLDEIFSPDSISLVEWPDRLGESLVPTWEVHLEIAGEGRRLQLRGPQRPGSESILAHLNQEICQ